MHAVRRARLAFRCALCAAVTIASSSSSHRITTALVHSSKRYSSGQHMFARTMPSRGPLDGGVSFDSAMSNVTNSSAAAGGIDLLHDEDGSSADDVVELIVVPLRNLLLDAQQRRHRTAAGGATTAAAPAAGAPAQCSSKLPLVPLSSLMVVLDADLKAGVNQLGGLLRTLRRFSPDHFVIAPSGLEAGVAGMSVDVPEAMRPLPRCMPTPSSLSSSYHYDRPQQVAAPSLSAIEDEEELPASSANKVAAAIASGLEENSSLQQLYWRCSCGVVDLSVPPLSRAQINEIFALRYKPARRHSTTDDGGGDDAEGEQRPCSGGEGPPMMMNSSAPPLGGEQQQQIHGIMSDSEYKARGFYTPREVADMYVPYCPTFDIDIKMFVRSLPRELRDPVWNPHNKRHLKPQDFIKRYGMVFRLTCGGKYRMTTIRLADTLEHPQKGRADAFCRRYRLNRGLVQRPRPNKGGGNDEEPILVVAGDGARRDEVRDADIANLLYRRLLSHNRKAQQGKATAGSCDDGGLFVSLAEFINSFPAEDIEWLNMDPPERVITVLQRHSDTFQLTGGGGG